jgi:hypothetical protein
MKRLLLACVLAAAATAQTEDRSRLSGSSSGQTMVGVLMDASCSTITPGSARPPGEQSTGATSGATSASAQGTTGSAPASTGTTGRAGSDDRGTSASGERRVRGTGATSGANSASALGTTGAAVTSEPGSAHFSDIPRLSESERRELITTVREKYRDCAARATSTAFALHANGKLYRLDPASNEMVRQQMRNEAFLASMTDRAGSPQFITVTVTGTPKGDALSVSSVRR